MADSENSLPADTYRPLHHGLEDIPMTPWRSFNTVFWGILIYTFTDFYYAYLDLIGMYNANSLIDSSYTLTCTLFAIGSYFRSIRPIRLASSTETPYEALPYNYGNSKKFQTLIVFLY